MAVVYLLLARPDPGLTQQAGVDSTPADGRAWIDTARNWRAEGEPDSGLRRCGARRSSGMSLRA